MKKLVIAILIYVFSCPCVFGDSEAKTRMKGMELCSFVGQGHTIRYALLPGTNRDKTGEEVREASVGYSGLIAAIKKLPPGETVLWFEAPLPEDMTCRYPDEETIADIWSVCEASGVHLEMRLSHEIIQKKWHVSPSQEPQSGTLYPYVGWSLVEQIEIGMTREDLEKVIHDVQTYHHPVNTIVYTHDPAGIPYEVAIKLSKDEIIEDLSFKTHYQNMPQRREVKSPDVGRPEPILFLLEAKDAMDEYVRENGVYPESWYLLDITFANGPHLATDAEIRPSIEDQKAWTPPDCEYTYEIKIAEKRVYVIQARDAEGNIRCVLRAGMTNPVIRITHDDLFHAYYRPMLKSVVESLRRNQEEPSEFYVDIEADGEDVLVFHLWHQDAFNKSNLFMMGNPGGKCRDVYYDVRQQNIVKELRWQ